MRPVCGSDAAGDDHAPQRRRQTNGGSRIDSPRRRLGASAPSTTPAPSAPSTTSTASVNRRAEDPLRALTREELASDKVRELYAWWRAHRSAADIPDRSA